MKTKFKWSLVDGTAEKGHLEPIGEIGNSQQVRIQKQAQCGVLK